MILLCFEENLYSLFPDEHKYTFKHVNKIIHCTLKSKYQFLKGTEKDSSE